MPRIRQLYPLAYLTNSAINGDFEQIIRYLNAAELGNKTLAELLRVLFDEQGELSAPIEMRLDPEYGLQYRVGDYLDEDEGWRNIATLSEVRGPAGLNIGELTAPVFYGRVDYTQKAGATFLEYAHREGETLMVFKNGILQREGVAYDYIGNPNAGVAGRIELNTPLLSNDLVTAFKIRTEAMNSYSRVDFDVTTPQVIFPINHKNKSDINVYKNGVLLREGGTFDYVASPDTSTISMMQPVTAGNRLTIVKFENSLSQTVAGFMMEKDYVDPQSGLISFHRLAISNDQIPQSKVDSLIPSLEARARIYVNSSQPSNPVTPSFWLNTALASPALFYFNGLAWVQINPENRLPPFGTGNINQILRVSPTGTGLEWGNIDLSGYLSINRIGASNGVAGLDNQGRLIKTQMPEVLTTQSFYYASGAGITNGKYTVVRPFKQKLRLIAVSLRTESGTASVTLTVGGVKTGSTFTASSTPSEFPLGSPVSVDAIATSIGIGFEVENANAANKLEVTIVAEVINA